MVKIVIMKWNDFSKMVYADLKNGARKGSFSRQDGVIMPKA